MIEIDMGQNWKGYAEVVRLIAAPSPEPEPYPAGVR